MYIAMNFLNSTLTFKQSSKKSETHFKDYRKFTTHTNNLKLHQNVTIQIKTEVNNTHFN